MPPTPPIAEVLAAGWGATLAAPATALKPDRVWQVRLSDGSDAVLKDWGVKDADLERRVAFYQSVATHVSKRGVIMERARPTVRGDIIHRREGHAWWLVPIIPNDSRPLSAAEGEELQRDYGRAIAALHRALASYPEEVARSSTWRKPFRDELISSLPAIPAQLADRDRARYDGIMSRHQAEILERLAGLPEQLIFFDCHHGNILRVGARVSGFIDSDHLSIGLRIWDLCYLIGQGVRWLETTRPAEWAGSARLVVDAYHAVNPLSERELGAIWHVLAAFTLGRLAGAGPAQAPNLLSELENRQRVREHFP
jgi:Ser/Thr protein kinase RdoA (MazF antagonist)